MEGDPSVAAAHFAGSARRAAVRRTSSPSSRIGPLELLLLTGNREAAAATLAEFEARPDNQNLAAKTNEKYFGRTGPERAGLVDALRQALAS